jgi:hypothetical protein
MLRARCVSWGVGGWVGVGWLSSGRLYFVMVWASAEVWMYVCGVDDSACLLAGVW